METEPAWLQPTVEVVAGFPEVNSSRGAHQIAPQTTNISGSPCSLASYGTESLLKAEPVADQKRRWTSPGGSGLVAAGQVSVGADYPSQVEVF